MEMTGKVNIDKKITFKLPAEDKMSEKLHEINFLLEEARGIARSLIEAKSKVEWYEQFEHGPSEITDFETGLAGWTLKHEEFQNLCFQIRNFIAENPEIAAKVIIRKGISFETFLRE